MIDFVLFLQKKKRRRSSIKARVVSVRRERRTTLREMCAHRFYSRQTGLWWRWSAHWCARTFCRGDSPVDPFRFAQSASSCVSEMISNQRTFVRQSEDNDRYLFLGNCSQESPQIGMRPTETTAKTKIPPFEVIISATDLLFHVPQMRTRDPIFVKVVEERIKFTEHLRGTTGNNRVFELGDRLLHRQKSKRHHRADTFAKGPIFFVIDRKTECYHL